MKTTTTLALTALTALTAPVAMAADLEGRVLKIGTDATYPPMETVDESTGTIAMRAVIPNPEKLVLPGQYTKIRLYVDDKPDAVLVPQKAVILNSSTPF